ncbi:MAG: 5-(carboxyamino)imidazole ribonucleotide synthase [Methylotenera sp.]|nr:5-(carboxyamino)imidazole ribonucleotide synthase [Oligoflexia bacterium]
MKIGTSAFQIGILGGGQLSKMLLEPAYRMGLHPLVYTDSSQDPAASLSPDAVYGQARDLVSLRRFLSQVAVCLFENEFVDCDLLEVAARGLNVEFIPALQTLKLLQNKLRQKKLLSSLEIPSAAYQEYDPKIESVKAWALRMLGEFNQGLVFKWAEQGYDGKGTFIVPAGAGTPGSKSGLEREVVSFCEQAHERGLPLFVEEKISFVRELAVIGCYSKSDEFTAYPLVISEQEKGICRKVLGPASLWGVSAELQAQAKAAAHKVAREARLFGCFGIEFFETHEGELLVNELAPRVHNTGHYTQDASQTSQFENHLRAVLGHPLGSTQSEPCFGMLNLLGPGGVAVPSASVRLPTSTSESHFHWYGKNEIRSGRKMGHFNLTARTPAELQKSFQKIETLLQAWAKEIRTS